MEYTPTHTHYVIYLIGIGVIWLATYIVSFINRVRNPEPFRQYQGSHYLTTFILSWVWPAVIPFCLVIAFIIFGVIMLARGEKYLINYIRRYLLNMANNKKYPEKYQEYQESTYREPPGTV